MGTPLYNTDVIPLTSRPTLTVMDDGDYFAILDTSTGKISKILKTNLVLPASQVSYNNSTSGLTAENVQAALDELVVNLGSSDSAISALGGRLDILEADDTTEGSVAKTVKDAVDPIETRIDTTELTLARTNQDLASVKQTLQQGNGATLDFSGIGSVALDARATGRANPTIYGSTVGSDSIQLPARLRSVGKNLLPPYVDESLRYSSNAVSRTLDGQGGIFLTALGSLSSYILSLPPSVKLRAGDVITFSFDASSDAEYRRIEILNSSTSTLAFDKLPLTTRTMIKLTVTVPDDGIVRIRFYLTSSITTGTMSIYSIQLERGSTATTYEPYTDSTLYIADNDEVRSFGATTDLVKVVNGEFVLEKKVNDDATAVISPPVITPLLTSGILQAKPNGTVYYEPYYEGSHQTDASSQITLPYEGTIEAVYGYDEDLVEYLLDSSEYSLTGTTLTITDALENEVFYVQMSRSEPLAPEMSVNVLNNTEVTKDSITGKFYKKTFTVADGIPTFGIEEVV